jgi:hypothetical protein
MSLPARASCASLHRHLQHRSEGYRFEIIKECSRESRSNGATPAVLSCPEEGLLLRCCLPSLGSLALGDDNSDGDGLARPA